MSCRFVNRLVPIILWMAGLQVPVQAQEFVKPTWWMGVAAGANLNDYRGTTQQLNSDVTLPAAFRHGRGVGLYLAPVVEYHLPASKWGVMLQVGYDSRQGSFNQITTPCNCPAELSTDLSYITVEPSIRFSPFKSSLYLFTGPRLAFNLTSSFKYSQGPNPDVPGQEPLPDVNSTFSNVNKTLLSMQVGAGYDISLTQKSTYHQVVLSPFVSFQPYVGQSPRSMETWTVSTLRVGAVLKFGRGRHLVKFSVNSPNNKPGEIKVKETFPLLNYVFFDEGSTVIPNRYVLLDKNQVPTFRKTHLETDLTPTLFSTWTDREMIVYHNVLNILGERMFRQYSSSITLVGSSRVGEEEGMAMAQSVSHYLTQTFDIDPARIHIEGLDRPKIPSEKRKGIYERDSLREGDDHRVSVESSTPELLMEFQSVNDTLKSLQEAPLDSYVNFQVDNGKDLVVSWMLEFRNETEKVLAFGPYTTAEVNIAGESILGDRLEDDYQVKMIGHTKKNRKVSKDTTVHVVRWTPPQEKLSTRYNVIFDFNESKITTVYSTYLIEKVIPFIPRDATVSIRGYTDCIGAESYNQTLSEKRAKAVMQLLDENLKLSGRSDVSFDVYGYGENPSASSFSNTLPEGRFYNRTAILDIVVKKSEYAISTPAKKITIAANPPR